MLLVPPIFRNAGFSGPGMSAEIAPLFGTSTRRKTEFSAAAALYRASPTSIAANGSVRIRESVDMTLVTAFAVLF